MRTLFVSCALLAALAASAQNRKVLLEEFTGAHCGICPNGAYYTDSMLATHPDLIAVALHSYGIYDAMVFPQVDSVGQTYAQGAPLGAVDRICSTPPSNNTAVYINQWDNAITQREQLPASLTMNVAPVWNSVTRNITAVVTVNMLSNLPSGDYRISLYVVEDSVTGTGSGYDQWNSYDTQVGSPWYGLGDPIVGYVHRHVARALLPHAWGLPGVIPSSPTTGQTFSTTFNYTLPAGYNENCVTLVAFVNEVSGTHTGDEVLNAEEVDLTGPTGVNEIAQRPFSIYVNPPDLFFIDAKLTDAQYEIVDVSGRLVKTGNIIANGLTVVDLGEFTRGVYFIRIFTQEEEWSEKVLTE